MPPSKHQESGGEDLPIKPPEFNTNLSNVQFQHSQKTVKGEGRAALHHLTAFAPDNPTRPLGVMYWHPKTGEIRGIGVQPEAQGKGLATAMWHRAHWEAERTNVSKPMKGQRTLFDPKPYTERARIVPPEHSAVRTGQGDIWAHKVGGYIPPRPPISRMMRAAMDLGDIR